MNGVHRNSATPPPFLCLSCCRSMDLYHLTYYVLKYQQVGIVPSDRCALSSLHFTLVHYLLQVQRTHRYISDIYSRAIHPPTSRHLVRHMHLLIILSLIFFSNPGHPSISSQTKKTHKQLQRMAKTHPSTQTTTIHPDCPFATVARAVCYRHPSAGNAALHPLPATSPHSLQTLCFVPPRRASAHHTVRRRPWAPSSSTPRRHTATPCRGATRRKQLCFQQRRHPTATSCLLHRPRRARRPQQTLTTHIIPMRRNQTRCGRTCCRT